jgi:hypothetical protein
MKEHAITAPTSAPIVLRMTSSTSLLRPSASWAHSIVTESANAEAVTRPTPHRNASGATSPIGMYISTLPARFSAPSRELTFASSSMIPRNGMRLTPPAPLEPPRVSTKIPRSVPASSVLDAALTARLVSWARILGNAKPAAKTLASTTSTTISANGAYLRTSTQGLSQLG